MTLYPYDYEPNRARAQYWRTPPMTPKPWERNGLRWSDLAAEIDADAVEPDPEPEAA